MRKIIFISFVVVQFTLSMLPCEAQDRVFSTTYQSNVLPYGVRDFEFWSTCRNGHKPNFYLGMDNRFEFEIGLGKNVQTSLYFNTDNSMQSDPNMKSDAITQDLGIGISNEWKWKIADPVANVVGCALYQEFELEPDEFEWESKLILDKRFGKNLIAFNAVFQYQLAFLSSQGNLYNTWNKPFEFDLGYMHFFGKGFGLGLEAKNHNDFSQGNGWENSLMYAGPSLFINGDGWLITMNFLPQLQNIHKTGTSPDNLVLDQHERYETRVVLSFSL